LPGDCLWEFLGETDYVLLDDVGLDECSRRAAIPVDRRVGRFGAVRQQLRLQALPAA
jgi:hypothetical protein